MAAVLYTNENDYIINENQEDDILADSVSMLVTCASDDVVRNFLIQILESDKKLLNKFKKFSFDTK